MKKWIIVWLVLAVFMTQAAFPVWAAANETEGVTAGSNQNESKPETPDEEAPVDWNNKRVGVQTGSNTPEIMADLFPDAKLSYFSTLTDMIAALEANKIDGFPIGTLNLEPILQEHPNIKTASGNLEYYETGVVFSKDEAGQKLKSEFDEWLLSMQESGAIDKIFKEWLTDEESSRSVPDFQAFPAPNGTLRMATEANYPPFEYYSNNKLAGIDVDIIAQFCEARGYGLEIQDMNFDSVLASVQTGKADLACSGISITEERKQSVLFSEPYYKGGTVMAVLDTNVKDNRSFLSSILTSIEKTFIREDRWKLFLSGTGTTMLITVLSILFGTILGFLVFMFCRNGNRVANAISGVVTWLVQGMPMVVLLMILYYVIFGSVAINGIFVAVIGFTLTFGASVFGLLKMGVGAVDPGQYEAAYALGHSNWNTFFSIILPQAIPHVMPAYKGEIVGLIKATAVVGYVAVQDLTKMGDIVRSRTYEAFFPLISVAIIYFVLEGLLAFAVSRISINTNPKRRSPKKILKGVEVHDQN